MKKLFLKWVLLNLVSTIVVLLSLICFSSPLISLNVFGKCVVGVMTAIYLGTSIYAGILCWRTDAIFESRTISRDGLDKRLQSLLHKADNISFQANECPFIGLFGAVSGFIFAMLGKNGLAAVSDASDIKSIIANCMTGIGIAFLTTLAGVFFRIVLMQMYHLIDNAIELKLADSDFKT